MATLNSEWKNHQEGVHLERNLTENAEGWAENEKYHCIWPIFVFAGPILGKIVLKIGVSSKFPDI